MLFRPAGTAPRKRPGQGGRSPVRRTPVGPARTRQTRLRCCCCIWSLSVATRSHLSGPVLLGPLLRCVGPPGAVRRPLCDAWPVVRPGRPAVRLYSSFSCPNVSEYLSSHVTARVAVPARGRCARGRLLQRRRRQVLRPPPRLRARHRRLGRGRAGPRSRWVSGRYRLSPQPRVRDNVIALVQRVQSRRPPFSSMLHLCVKQL